VTDPADQQLTLHSGWFGIALSYLGAFAVFLAGVVSVVGSGGAVVSIVVLIVGTLFVIGVLVDYPIASTFSKEGVQRRALMRHHFLPWGSIMISRARPSLRALQRELAPGGFVAVAGRRRYLLVDRVESGAEYDRLETLCRAWGVELSLGIRPSDKVVPTWLYRRRRWAPDDASGR
jgi:hypothetical protein